MDFPGGNQKHIKILMFINPVKHTSFLPDIFPQHKALPCKDSKS